MGTSAKGDRQVLRELGLQVAEIAALDQQQTTKGLWTVLNGLGRERPMVMIDQIPWHEMGVDDELTLHCIDPLHRQGETDLRRRLYKWRHLRHDLVIDTGCGGGQGDQRSRFRHRSSRGAGRGRPLQ